MSESHLGEIFGEEEPSAGENSEEAVSPGSNAEAFAAAVAAIASRQDPRVAQDTSQYLKKQAQVLKIQAQHLSEEHQFRIQHLRNQLKEESVRHLGLRLKVAFQIFVALVSTALALGGLILLHDAFVAHDIILEPFDTPATFEARGLSGKTLASSLLDELRHLQNTTRANVERKTFAQSWSEEIKVEIPEVGVSVGELTRAMRARFGHDWHVTGDVIAVNDGQVTLTVRSPEFDSKTFDGAATEVPKLITRAAEYVYSKAEPVLWAYYLNSQGRNQEAVEFCKGAFAGADKSMRPYLLNAWADALSDAGTEIELYRAAIRLKPDYWTAYYNLELTQATSGAEEAALQTARDMQRAAGGRPGAASEPDFQIFDWLTYNLPALLASHLEDAKQNGGMGTMSIQVGVNTAIVQIRMHDITGAAFTLQTVKAEPTDKFSAAVASQGKGLIAAARGDLSTAVAHMEEFWSLARPQVVNEWVGSFCAVAPVEEAAGRSDKADEVLRTAPRSLDCLRFHGDILDSRGKWDEAQKAYAEAIAYAPDLPTGYYSWGTALIRHKDLTGALDKLKAASLRGPHWADPLKAIGDVLLMQGRADEALAAYERALEYAPKWVELQLAHDLLRSSRSH